MLHVMKKDQERPFTIYGVVAMWASLFSVTVGTISYYAASSWVKCPAEYGDVGVCHETEDLQLLLVLAVYGAMALCLASATMGMIALFKREPLWSALIPIGVGVVFVLSQWIFGAPRM